MISDRGAICTYQKCPQCGGRFHRREHRLTWVTLDCASCGAQPTRYYIDIYDTRGRRHRISRGEQGELLATPEAANALLASIRRQPDWDPSRFVTRLLKDYLFENVVDLWLRDAKRRVQLDEYSYGTLELKERMARFYFLPTWRGRDIREITNHQVEDFRLDLNRAPVTVNNILMQLRSLFRYSFEAGVISELPKFRRIRRTDKPPPEVLGREEQALVFQQIPKKHQPIFRFLMLTGCRVSMARALQWEDINWRDRCILFRHNYSAGRFTSRLKSRKPLLFPLTKELEKLLKNLPRDLRGHVFINPSTSEAYSKNLAQILNPAFDRAGIRRLPVKNFTRHSFAFNWLESGQATTRDVSYLMGHGSEQVTRSFYDNVRRGRLAEILDGFQGNEPDKSRSKTS